MVKKNTEYKGIQKKLVAAVAMVLVASIMVVTSSYAWFTLSTAPEVTGINTSVGSNGNLEIALRTDATGANITNSTGAIFPAANNYWGNLVDLSSDVYHLNDITLMPAAIQATQVTGEKIEYTTDADGYIVDTDGVKLNFGTEETPVYYKNSGVEGGLPVTLTQEMKTKLESAVVKSTVAAVYQFDSDSYIKVPTYGADGRVSDFNTTSFTSVYDTSAKGFVASDTVSNYGVRAVGTSSNMDPAELAMLNARKAVSGAKSTALFGAKGSLSDDATKIANIVIKNQVGGGNYSEDVPNVRAAITNLQTVTAALEDAIRSSVVALGVSQSVAIDKTAITFTLNAETSKYEIGGTGALLWQKDAVGTDPDAADYVAGYDYTVYKTMLETAYGEVQAMNKILSDASDDLAPIEAAPATANYTNLMAVVANILKTSDIQLDGKGITTYDVGTLASKLMGGSKPADVDIVDGIYCDIALFVGNYSTPATLKVNGTFPGFGTVNQSVTVNMVTQATMPTTPGNAGCYLDSAYAWLNTLKAGTITSTATLMNDLYAYIIDLAFRTNAANSNLLLQTEAADRVYQDAAAGSVTQGAGSYMEFSSGNPSFSILQMVNLMENIRVLFFDTEGEIIAVAGLDVALNKNAQKKNEAGQPLYYVVGNDNQPTDTETTEVTNFPVYLQAKDAQDNLLYIDALGQVTTDGAGNEPLNADPSFTITSVANKTIQAKLYLYNYTILDGKVTLDGKAEKQIISALDQNTVKALSAMVYLDGNEVENADVAVGGNSLTGKLNLQFASDATLDPMDYTFGQQLTTPTIESNTNGVLVLKNVTNMKEYKISCGSYSTTVTADASGSTTIDLSSLKDKGIPDGTYTITIVAAGTGYIDSKPVPVEYELVNTPAPTP